MVDGHEVRLMPVQEIINIKKMRARPTDLQDIHMLSSLRSSGALTLGPGGDVG
jgi:hypothetical protein